MSRFMMPVKSYLFYLGPMCKVHKKIIHLKIYLAMRVYFKGFTRGRALGLAGRSPPVITFFPISEFFYKLMRFLLHSSEVEPDNEIDKFSF